MGEVGGRMIEDRGQKTEDGGQCHWLISDLCPLSSVLCPLSSVLCPLSSVLCPFTRRTRPRRRPRENGSSHSRQIRMRSRKPTRYSAFLMNHHGTPRKTPANTRHEAMKPISGRLRVRPENEFATDVPSN